MTNSKLVLRNDKSVNHHDYSLELTRWFLKPLGAWPEINTSNVIENVLVHVQILICWSTVIFISGPCLLFILFEAPSIPAQLGALGPLVHRIMGSVHYFTLLKRRKDFRDCIQHMQMDWQLIQRIDDREIMIQYAKFGRLISGFCGMIMQGSTMLFSIARAMKTVTIVVDNQTLTVHPMTCPSYQKFIDTRFSPTNEIVLSVQFFSTFVVSSATAGVCSLAAVFATHACGQLNVLYKRLDELDKNDEKEDQSAERKMVVIVEHHLRVLSQISRMENIMHKTCLVQIMGSTINMCLLGYYSIMNWANFDAAKITSYVITYVSFTYNLFIFCYIGEILTEQCKNVGHAAYMTNWYNLSPKTARGLVLIIAQSSKVVKITAGKMFSLSIATFGDVIKTSVAYLNILRTVAM